MTGFEPQTSGIGSDRSSNRATTTARDYVNCLYLPIQISFLYFQSLIEFGAKRSSSLERKRGQEWFNFI